jgi:hypothetical protein
MAIHFPEIDHGCIMERAEEGRRKRAASFASVSARDPRVTSVKGLASDAQRGEWQAVGSGVAFLHLVSSIA